MPSSPVLRRTLLIGGVALLLLIGLAVVLWQQSPRKPDAEPDPGPTPSVLSTPSGRPSTEVPSSPGPVDLADVTWQDLGGFQVPVSRAAGPTTAAERARGFAHTPTGALLAGVHLLARVSASAGPAVFRPTLAEQVVGVDAGALSAQTEQTSTSGQRSTTSLAGYRIDTYTAETAYLRILLAGPARPNTSSLVDLRLQVQWVGGDWKLVAPPNGQWETVSAQVADSSGYHQFPPRR